MAKIDAMKANASLGGRSAAFPPGIDPSQATARPKRLEGARSDRSAMSIEVAKIVRDPDQPRKEFDADELDRLTRSVATQGVLMPIRVRWDEPQGVYVVLMGERRWRAATAAGLREIPCIVHDKPMSAAEKTGLQVIENALREDLKPIEQAKAYQAMMEANGWNAKQVAIELNLSPSSVTRALSMLELPAVVQDRVEQGAISPSTAAEIAKLDRPEDQLAVAEAVERESFGRDEVSQIVKAVKAQRPTKKSQQAGPVAAPVIKQAPHVYETDEYVVTVKWKRAGGPPLNRIAGDFVRYAKSLKEQNKMGQGGTSETEAIIKTGQGSAADAA